VATRHVVRQGECLLSLASRYGLPDAATLFDHPDNAELKALRKSPYRLLPGDVVSVPEREPKQASVATGQEHRFRVKLPTAKLRLFLKGPDGSALADKRYLLRFGTTRVEGTTDGAGKVEVSIPAELDAADLDVWVAATGESPDLTLPIRVGHLDPVDTPSGWKARLAHLGFPSASGGERAALVAFQRKYGLDPSGEADDATRAKLESLHDEES